MAITKATKLIVGLLATGGVSGGIAGGYYLLKPKATESYAKTPNNGRQTSSSTTTGDSNQNLDRSDVSTRDSNPSTQGHSGPGVASSGGQRSPAQPSDGDRGESGPSGAGV